MPDITHPWCVLCDAGHDPCEDYDTDSQCIDCGRTMTLDEVEAAADPVFLLCRTCERSTTDA